MAPEKKSGMAIFGACALLGSAIFFVTTRWGVGLSPDSVVYVGAARSLLQAEGFTLPTSSGNFAPIVHYPPLYSGTLAVFGFLGLDLLDGARWINASLFGGSAFLASYIILISTKSPWFSALGCLFMITAFPLIQVHTMAWSEPLFLFLMLGGGLFSIRYLETAAYKDVLMSASLFGLSILARYAGAALVVSGVAAILLLGDGRWRNRVLHSILFLAASLIPIGFWLMRNWFVAGSTINRKVVFNPWNFEFLDRVTETVASWFSFFLLPPALAKLVLLGAIGVTGSVCLLGVLRTVSRSQGAVLRINWRTPMLMSFLGGGYLLLLFLSITFLDAQTPIDSRLLSPVYIALVILGISLVSKLSGDQSRTRRGGVILGLIAIGLVFLQAGESIAWLTVTHRDGIGYASREWKQSELVRDLGSLGVNVPVFSNAPDVVYALLGRASDMIPRKMNPDTRLPNENYNHEIANMREKLERTDGVVAYFDRVHWRWYLPSAKELNDKVTLRLLSRRADGAIYRIE